ncbi:extracellular solute-binding protein [Streptococcus suis]|uniref:extracellular solute-binding protein n=1 Tax=Streptococcus suis TaxID=1307 RepID=UPI00022F8B15|nr:extracellular solute-binding protein [Streptococcus suis]AER17311.1 extracellular solute-binding protein, family 1 [Streptococcus suis D9]
MVTIKDIAREAGVSHGTASNVLNKRGNVRSSKIKLVEEAAKRLGYQLNSQAQVLRKGLSKKVCVFIPYFGRFHYTDLIDFLLTFDSDDYDIDLVYFKNQVDLDERIIKISSLLPLAVVCLGLEPTRTTDIENQGTKLILVDNKNNASINFDIDRIHALVLNFLEVRSNGIVTLISPYDGFFLFENLHRVLLKSDFRVRLLTDSDNNNIVMTYSKLSHLTANDTIVVSDGKVAKELIDLFNWFGKTDRPHILVLGCRDIVGLQNTSYLKLDYKLVAKRVLSVLENNDYSPIELKGIETHNEDTCQQVALTLTLAIVESPMSNAIKVLVEKYKAMTGITIRIEEFTYQKLLANLSNRDFLNRVDLIRVDMAWLPNFAETIFQEVTNQEVAQLINSKLMTGIALEYSYQSDRQYTFPFDISSQVLVYRKDLFDNTLLQRQYYEKFKKQLDVPKTFEEFDRVSFFFSKSFNKDSETDFGHTLAVKTPIVATCDFMPRYREKLLNNSMNLSVINEAFNDYKKSVTCTNGKLDLWWEDHVKNLRLGHTAMEIVFSNYISPLFSGSEKYDVTYQFDIASVPGKQAMTGGGSIGISRYSVEVTHCLNFLKWLYSPDVSRLLAYLGGVLPVETVIEDTNLGQMYPWFENFKETFSQGSRSNWHDFVTDLDFENILGRELIERFSE